MKVSQKCPSATPQKIPSSSLSQLSKETFFSPNYVGFFGFSLSWSEFHRENRKARTFPSLSFLFLSLSLSNLFFFPFLLLFLSHLFLHSYWALFFPFSLPFISISLRFPVFALWVDFLLSDSIWCWRGWKGLLLLWSLLLLHMQLCLRIKGPGSSIKVFCRIMRSCTR